MNNFRSIIKADYLQRTRSYIFIVTLLVSSFMAYSFVPDDNDLYTTVHIGNYVGYNNAAWIGHITAIMASVFLWLIGFYIINNGIRRDHETGVGQIIATTSISNYSYLLAKSLSNFLILLTITAIIILVSLGLVLYRENEYSFNVIQFFLPYFLTTLPSLFFVSVFAVFFEVFFGKRTNLSNITFFFLFPFVVKITQATNNSNLMWFDVLGIKFLTSQLTSFVNTTITHVPQNISVGFNFGTNLKINHFLFQGSNFSIAFILSRLLWIAISFGILKISAKLFNRFNSKEAIAAKDKKVINKNNNTSEQISSDIIKMKDWPKASIDFSISPLIKTEFILLLNKGPKWFWLVNMGGFIALFILPLNTAHIIALPILWFLQINRWADLSTKEKDFGTDSFIFATYKPLQRLLYAQMAAGTALALILASPLLARYFLSFDLFNILEIILGAIILISFSIFSGILFKGKRFFEIAFFFTTYAIIQKIPFLDYLGSSQTGFQYLATQFIISCSFLALAFSLRQYEVSKQ